MIDSSFKKEVHYQKLNVGTKHYLVLTTSENRCFSDDVGISSSKEL